MIYNHSTVNAFIFTVWIAGTLAKIAGALCLWRRGLAGRLGVLMALLVVLSAQSAVALEFALAGNWASYAQVYGVFVWAATAFEGFAMVNAFWLVAENYPRVRVPGLALLAGLAGIGAGSLWISGNINPPAGWYGIWHSAIWVQRSALTILVFALCGARALLPRISGVPISRLAKRAADILTLHASFILASTIIDVLGGEQLRYNAVSSVLIVTNGLMLGVLCVWLSAQHEVYEDAGAGVSEERQRLRFRLATAFHSMFWSEREKMERLGH